MTTDQQASIAIAAWAKRHFAPGIDDPLPEVEVVHIKYDHNEDLWEAELNVSSSATPHQVTFWLDDTHELMENRLHVLEVKK